ncbi:MAG: hypothetical protein WC593_15175 [Methanoregula sp.]
MSKYDPTPPLKLGNWVRIIGQFEKLPEKHPVVQRLDMAGMGPDLKLDNYSGEAA